MKTTITGKLSRPNVQKTLGPRLQEALQGIVAENFPFLNGAVEDGQIVVQVVTSGTVEIEIEYTAEKFAHAVGNLMLFCKKIAGEIPPPEKPIAEKDSQKGE